MAQFNPYRRDRSYVEIGSVCLMVQRRLMNGPPSFRFNWGTDCFNSPAEVPFFKKLGHGDYHFINIFHFPAALPCLELAQGKKEGPGVTNYSIKKKEHSCVCHGTVQNSKDENFSEAFNLSSLLSTWHTGAPIQRSLPPSLLRTPAQCLSSARCICQATCVGQDLACRSKHIKTGCLRGRKEIQDVEVQF